MRGGIAERGGVRVGHRIIEINGQSVVAMAHEKIVQTLSVSVGEVRIHTQDSCFLVIAIKHKHRPLSHLIKYIKKEWVNSGCNRQG